MEILIRDEKTGKEYLIKGADYEWEIFKRSKGRKVKGEVKGEGQWTTCYNYPTTVSSAVGKVINWLLANPDDPDAISTTALKAEKQIAKAIDKRVNEITMEVLKNV